MLDFYILEPDINSGKPLFFLKEKRAPFCRRRCRARSPDRNHGAGKGARG